MFDKIDEFINVHNRIRHLILFDQGQDDEISNNTKYPVSEKSGITVSINYNFARIKIDSYNSLPTEKQWLLIIL